MKQNVTSAPQLRLMPDGVYQGLPASARFPLVIESKQIMHPLRHDTWLNKEACSPAWQGMPNVVLSPVCLDTIVKQRAALSMAA